MKQSKKLVSLFLALAFALSLMTMSALAAETRGPVVSENCPKCGTDMMATESTYSYEEDCPSGVEDGKHTVTVTQIKGTCPACRATSVFYTGREYSCGHCR